jgi:hypothetical protein
VIGIMIFFHFFMLRSSNFPLALAPNWLEKRLERPNM